MIFKKSFYFIFLLIFIFKLLPSFYCFKGICEILKLTDVGESTNDGCPTVPYAVKYMDRCCIQLNCKTLGMMEVGSPDDNGKCEDGAQFVNNQCCDIPPCTKNQMDDIGRGMEGVCDGKDTKYIDGRCCVAKKEPPTTTTPKPSTTTPLGLYVNGRFFMNCADKESDRFCQDNINKCMQRNGRRRNWGNRGRNRINKKYMAFNCCNSCRLAFKDFLPTLYGGGNNNNDYDDINDYNNDDGYGYNDGYNNNGYRGNGRRNW
uniref:Uncharacterized protein n=1 Tax=Meloidogyne enterolobii TaxID=390850 RepID=A0A6V7WAL5_MELEN|nr:unnamed protein product [Meloidogyne enterolobii]